MAFLRRLLYSISRPQRLVRPKNLLGDYRPYGGVLSPGYQRALEDELKSVGPEDEQVPDDERGLPGLREAFKKGEAEAESNDA